jgi:phosphorylase kinase alpha/beta subunit
LQELQQQAQDIILTRQDPHTGLLPASTAITVHGDYTHAWVRDNVYSILAIWALGLASRRLDPDAAAPLEASVVQLMRGLLTAMMRQAHKVERFKHSQSPMDALHAKYDTARGEPVVGDSDWGHLQIDATAVYVLLLAQMSASGLVIVKHAQEVAFVQNLVYYLSKAWRIRDYGIWERGHKGNLGVAELNASSVGMAKAALEAIDGFEPLPGAAPPILVDADDVAQARNTLEALLPRESESKETDAALLSIVGFPGFAVDDPDIAARTRELVLTKLEGRYGCKRFLRDGHQSVVEDHQRLYYEPGELQRFEHIESEWPLFFTYLMVDAALLGRDDEALSWRKRLESLMQERDGLQLLPELYFVPPESVDAERAVPHSQVRVPNANLPLVWAQSLYLLGVLLHEGYLDPDDIDPLQRRRRFAARSQPTVQISLLAEDDLVRARLAARGLAAQTVAEVAPLKVRDAGQLAMLLTRLGEWKDLGLSGRPLQPLRSLASSHLFVRGNERSVCLPAFDRQRGHYLTLDNRLLAVEIGIEVATLQRHWHGAGEPIMPLLINASMLDAPGADVLLDQLIALRDQPGNRVIMGPLDELLDRAAVRRLDGLPDWPQTTPEITLSTATAAILHWDEAATRPLTAERNAAIAAQNDHQQLRQQLTRSRNPYEQIEVLARLWQLAGPEGDTGLGGNVRQITEALYTQASQARRWAVTRRAAGLLELHDDTLEDAVAEIVARGKRVALGRAYSPDSVVSRPLENRELHARLRNHGGDDLRGRVMIEEIVLLLGLLVKADARLFDGMLTLRPWQAVLLLTGWLAREHGLIQAKALTHLLDLSPHAILGRLREVIAREQEMAANLVQLQALHGNVGPRGLVQVNFSANFDPDLGVDQGGWLGWREMTGVLSRVPDDFHARVWQLLQHCAGLVIGDQLNGNNRVDSRLARADSTAGERSFALHVDELISRIHAPEYRQLTIEALLALSEITRANPDLHIADALVLDVIIGRAVRLGWLEVGRPESYNEQVAQAWADFYTQPPHRVANLVVAAMAYLLDASQPIRESTEPAPDRPIEASNIAMNHQHFGMLRADALAQALETPTSATPATD